MTAIFLFMTNTLLKISGMTCQNCVRHVKDALLEIPGVESVDVSLEKANAQIISTLILDQVELKKVLEAAGYTVQD